MVPRREGGKRQFEDSGNNSGHDSGDAGDLRYCCICSFVLTTMARFQSSLLNDTVIDSDVATLRGRWVALRQYERIIRTANERSNVEGQGDLAKET